MKFRDFSLVLVLLVSGSVAAESSNAIPDMNSVWRDYNAAVESGDADTVLSTARRALTFGEQNFVAGDERIAIVTMNYGTALLAAERQEEAREILDLALERYEAIHGQESGVLIPVLQELADANANKSDFGQQAMYYERAAMIAATQYGESTTGYADVLLRSGKHLYLESQSSTGKKDLETAYDIYVAELGPDDLRTADAAYFLGKIEFSDRRFRNAEKHLTAALGGFETETSIGHQRQLLTRALLVQAYEFLGDSGRATEHCIAIGQLNMLAPDREHRPLFQQAPDYPLDMLATRREGFVDVGFTVDKDGFVQNPVVLKQTGGQSFEQAALDAVEQFRYAPKFVNGSAVETRFVKTRVTFSIE